MVSPGADVPSWAKVWLTAGHRRIAERARRCAGLAVEAVACFGSLVEPVLVDLDQPLLDQFVQMAGAGIRAQGVVLGIGELAGCSRAGADGAQHCAVAGGDHAAAFTSGAGFMMFSRYCLTHQLSSCCADILTPGSSGRALILMHRPSPSCTSCVRGSSMVFMRRIVGEKTAGRD